MPSVRSRVGAWRSPRRPLLVALALLAVLGGSFWLGRTAVPPPTIPERMPTPGAAQVLSLAQGWPTQVQERAWFTSFGSRLLPYAWFVALEQPASAQPFRAPAFLGGLGFLPHAPSAADPDGLPVGLAATSDAQGERWLGFGCPACHTGQWRFGGRSLRIAGGSGRLDLQRFEQLLADAMRETRDDPAKFARFAAALGASGDAASSLRRRLDEVQTRFARRLDGNRTEVPYGPGRMDAFGQIFNAVGADALGIPENRQAPDAPVSIPVLWSTPRLSRVQWNGSSPNDGLAPVVQNVTTALGVYGSVDPTPRSPFGYDSSADVHAMGDIQRWNAQLQAPRWPETVLGRIDPARAARGAALYARDCGGCHRPLRSPPREDDFQVVMVPVDEVGTDPRMADNFLSRQGRTGPLQGRPAMVVRGAPLPARAPMIDIVVHMAVGATLRHPMTAIGATLAGRVPVPAAPEPANRRVYKARPLDGIWASPPYLHNGSVPSLADLLTPPARRPVRFMVGSDEYDPARVGLATGASPGSATFVFDTRLPGNGNAGHAYGTDLDPADRAALLEYLKTL